jgi:hypothetical protein
MNRSTWRRSRRWVLRELDLSAAAWPVQAGLANIPTGQNFGATSNGDHHLSAN